jgi:hypothetical protein
VSVSGHKVVLGNGDFAVVFKVLSSAFNKSLTFWTAFFTYYVFAEKAQYLRPMGLQVS